MRWNRTLLRGMAPLSPRVGRRALRLAPRAMREAMRTATRMMQDGWSVPTEFATHAARAAGVIRVDAFGANPGDLRMNVYAPPATPKEGAALIVVLHGCGQSAAGFADEAGFIALADRLGVPLLLPEQVEANNRGRCFNWFEPADIARGTGEAASIRAMVAEATTRFGSDPKRVFVVGLSAGAAMAAALLAAYPTTFAAGAAVAGLPVGCARDLPQALTRMSRAGPRLDDRAWADRARAIGPKGFAGPWPRLSVWHGTADHSVSPENGETLARQFAALHGIDPAPVIDAEVASNARRRAFGDPARPQVELWTVAGMGHGFPIDASQPGHGRPGFAVLDASLPAADRIARFWGLG